MSAPAVEWQHATDHPHYVATKAAREAAEALRDEAADRFTLQQHLVAHYAVHLGMAPDDRDRAKYLAAELDAARAQAGLDYARAVWMSVRESLGLR